MEIICNMPCAGMNLRSRSRKKKTTPFNRPRSTLYSDFFFQLKVIIYCRKKMLNNVDYIVEGEDRVNFIEAARFPRASARSVVYAKDDRVKRSSERGGRRRRENIALSCNEYTLNMLSIIIVIPTWR